MTRILALAGRKQSGKNTAYNFMLGVTLLRLSVVRGSIEIKDDGNLFVSDLFGDEELGGIARFVNDRSEKIDYFNNTYVYPFIRNYSFADLLKQSVCMDLLGLSWEQCYGTDEQKNSPTHLRWEDMPGVVTRQSNIRALAEDWQRIKESKHLPDDSPELPVIGRLGKYYTRIGDIVCHEPGPMTGREVMQFAGTEIFRKMYHNVWAESTVRRIQKDESKFAVITDCRFPNEVEAVQKAGGKVIRFTRNPHPEDTHESETALDQENFDWGKFDAVIDNSNMTISDQNGALHHALEEFGWGDLIKIDMPVKELVK